MEKRYIYDCKTKNLMLEVFADEVKYVCKREEYNLWEGYIFIFKDNDKVGIYQDSFYGSINISSKHVNISPKYDKIEYLDDGFYAFYTGDKCDIDKLRSLINPVVKNCKIVEVVNEGLIFKKDNTYGVLISKNRHNLEEDDIVLDEYDNIKYLGSGLFEFEKDGKKGVCCRGNIIIPLIYQDIDLHISKSKKHFCMENVCFALIKDNKSYEFAYKEHWDTYEDNVQYETSRKYRSIEFLPDVMILKDRGNAYIYDYSKSLLTTMSSKIEVSVIERKGYNNKRLYCIDSEYYVYQDNKFEKILMEELDLYMTAYESDSGTVVVNSYDKQEHNKICEQIELDGEDAFDRILIEYYEGSADLQEKYPSLVKKRISPKKNY